METSLNLMVARTVSKYLCRLGGWKVVDQEYGQMWDEKSEGQMQGPKRRKPKTKKNKLSVAYGPQAAVVEPAGHKWRG
jgi:hypothetical protein